VATLEVEVATLKLILDVESDTGRIDVVPPVVDDRSSLVDAIAETSSSSTLSASGYLSGIRSEARNINSASSPEI
jgi:hypothetical protein